MNQLKELIQKICTKEVLSYTIFGILTTVVNIVVSTILNKFFSVEGNIASTIGIIACILFAYFTNRKWVFHSQAKTAKEKWAEFIKFILGRGITMVIEMVGFFLLYTICLLPFLFSKCIITVIVIILNYFLSKFFAFKQSN